METPRYKLRAVAWIHNDLQPAGTEVEYEGEPGYNLEPMNDAAKAMYAKYKPQPEGVPQLTVVPPGPPVGWESAALAAGWTPPGFQAVAATPPPTTEPAALPGRATKPAAVVDSAAGGTSQSPDEGI